jgi:hypothetical protein
MSLEDRAQAAERLLDDKFAMGLLEVIEQAAVEAMIEAADDQGRREARDTVKTVRNFRLALQRPLEELKEVKAKQERQRQGYGPV